MTKILSRPTFAILAGLGLALGCRVESPVPLVPVDLKAKRPVVDSALLELLQARPKSVRQAAIRFRDVSDTTGITFIHCSGNSPKKNYPTANGSGVAMFDYDGDGKLDLYFATTRELPLDAPTQSGGNRLYRNKGDGTFEDVTERAGVGFRGFNHGLAVGDVDGNGYADLYLTNFGRNVLYLNNGNGTFREAGPEAGVGCGLWSSGAAFFDLDNDGDLDLYVTCYGRWASGESQLYCGNADKGVRTYCSPLTITPERHFLFRNKGNGTFEDITKQAGIYRDRRVVVLVLSPPT